jgi:hypothetical protein
MSEIACYLQATTKRPEYLRGTIESINKLSDRFCEKFISIYGEELPSDIVSMLEDNNWTIDFFSGDRISSFKRSVNSLSAKYIFYIEDDIDLLEFPTEIESILQIKDNDRVCGLLSMNLGGSTLRYPHCFGDFPNMKSFVKFDNGHVVSFIRRESLRNDFFFEFPCVIMDKEMLMDTLPNLSNNQIEMALTLEFDKLKSKYYKASLCNPEVYKFVDSMNEFVLIPNFDAELEKVKFYKLLDPNQGGLLSGSN